MPAGRNTTCRAAIFTLFIMVSSIFSAFAVFPAGAGTEAAKDAPAPAALSPAAKSEISTDELKDILKTGKFPVFDVRPTKEYGISHIPGSVNIFERDLERIMELCPDKSAGLVLYCNGPYCGKTGRVEEQLLKSGYVNVKKYQHGLPVWRALGNVAETDITGFKYVIEGDKTAFFVDARPQEEYRAGSVPGAVNIKSGDVEAANRDGRLPYADHGTRVIVFGSAPAQARQLAEEIAHRAYWNSSYFSGRIEDLKHEGIF